MTCSKKLTNKYVGRPGPPYGAQDCPGKRKRGNDGLMYESKPSQAGVYRWVKAPVGSKKRSASKKRSRKVSKKRSRKVSKKRSRKKSSRKRSLKASSAMTVVELKALCRGKGIKGYSTLNKAQLVRKCGAKKPSRKPSRKTTKKRTVSRKAGRRPPKKTTRKEGWTLDYNDLDYHWMYGLENFEYPTDDWDHPIPVTGTDLGKLAFKGKGTLELEDPVTGKVSKLKADNGVTYRRILTWLKNNFKEPDPDAPDHIYFEGFTKTHHPNRFEPFFGS